MNVPFDLDLGASEAGKTIVRQPKQKWSNKNMARNVENILEDTQEYTNSTNPRGINDSEHARIHINSTNPREINESEQVLFHTRSRSSSSIHPLSGYTSLGLDSSMLLGAQLSSVGTCSSSACQKIQLFRLQQARISLN